MGFGFAVQISMYIRITCVDIGDPSGAVGATKYIISSQLMNVLLDIVIDTAFGS